jgi:hypothetical protein
MCRTVAAAQGAAAVVFDSAILVLFIPALTLFTGTLVLAFRFRSSGAGEPDSGPADLAVEILRLFREPETEAWDLHALFEFTSSDDPRQREAVLDTVERLSKAGYLESRGSDFYTLTQKGLDAAQRGSL